METTEFKKYQHIERLGTTETEGILSGMVYVFPKIDGTNGQLWWDGKLQAGSRNRVLSAESDNAGFWNWAVEQDMFSRFFAEYPNVKLYGEWLVPHTLRTYEDLAWRKFYVFDVVDGFRHLAYDEYQPMVERFGIEYIPPICKIKDPTHERMIEQLEKNTYLIKDGEGSGEGIVIKNYNYRNRFGHVIWAKIVKNEFKAKHQKADVTELKEKKLAEDQIVDKFVTLAMVEKEYAKIAVDGWSSKYIPRLLNTVFYTLVKEECWNFVKDLKNPTIDFKLLNYKTTERVKSLMSHLF
jgi:hypothetical protein